MQYLLMIDHCGKCTAVIRIEFEAESDAVALSRWTAEKAKPGRAERVFSLYEIRQSEFTSSRLIRQEPSKPVCPHWTQRGMAGTLWALSNPELFRALPLG